MAHPPRITSRQNQRVKDAARLRTRRERERQGRFLIDGSREILRAIDAGIRCIEAFVCEKLCDAEGSRRAVEALQSAGTEVLHVTTDVYVKLCFGERDEGVVVVAELPRRSLADLRVPAEPLVAVVEGIEKPGNLGAILRCADAAGVDAVVAAESRTDLFNPNTIRASLGTVFRKNVCTATTEDAMRWLRERGVTIVAARPNAETLYTVAELRGSVAIVLGGEAGGLTDLWQGPGVQAVRLPMHGIADSLNVSTTAAVLFYEALRQREGR